MLLTHLFEAKIGATKVGAAMTKIVSYLERSIGGKLRKLGREHFHNSKGEGWGDRYLLDGTTECIRFNWAGNGKSSEIESVDIWNGNSRDPNFNVKFDGVSLVKALPDLARVLKTPKIGKHKITGKEAALSEGQEKKTYRVEYKDGRDDIIKTVRAIDDDEAIDQILNRVPTAKNVQAYLVEASLGSRQEFLSYKEWKSALPPKSDVIKSDKIERAQARTKDFEGVAGQWDHAKNKGWIYAHYLDKRNLTEAKKGEYNEETSIADFIAKLESGRSFTRSDFVDLYHPTNAHAFDAFIKKHADKLVKTGSRYSLPDGEKFGSAGGTSEGTLEVSRGGRGEEYDVEVPEQGRISFNDSLEHLEGLTQGLIKGSFNALFVAGKGGTGKTQTVERVLEKNGLTDGSGYFKNTGSASAIGVYTLLYKYRDSIILFDDSDGALGDQDARNLIKAATDTKKVRKMVWNKKSAGMYDPDAEGEDSEGEEDPDRIPKYFNFTGRIIFISNLPLNKLDPDGALRTRAFVIVIDPTSDEIFEKMGDILHDIKLEDGLTLSAKERDKVLAVVKTSRRKSEASLRTLVRSLNLAASGAPNWERLVELYA